jgi:ATP-dependent Clp protease adapter protein ClpS
MQSELFRMSPSGRIFFKIHREGDALHSIFEKELSGKVVAGAGFEPTTFGL